MLKKFSIMLSLFSLLLIHPINLQNSLNIFDNGNLEVSENGRFLQFVNGKPFFWLGDTGWLLFSKLTREEADKYLQDRHSKGFNVIQAMILNGLPEVNAYGDSAFTNNNPAETKVTSGKNPDVPGEYDFWDHIDYIVHKAESDGIFISMVPVWGSNIRNNIISKDSAEKFVTWLAERYKDSPNIIWINGGDTRGDENLEKELQWFLTMFPK